MRATIDVGRAVIDSLGFVRDGGVLAGNIPVAALTRVVDVLVDSEGTLACELRGVRDAEGKPCLDLVVTGSLNLLCQRCLTPVSFALAIDSRLLLVASGDSWPDEELADDGVDAIEASRELAVSSLIEDEVLLALPIVPRHETCRTPVATETRHRPSPFAVLGKLKDH